jgi:transcriptional regulator with XRE-family HTH domain
MHLRCRLREFRGRRTLREVAAVSGLPVSLLSQLERGRMVPTDAEIRQLEPAYGRLLRDWYDWRGPLLVVDMDEEEEAA